MTTRSQGFTGWHMLAMTSAFFAVIIAVNVTMAWYASSSWSGLVADDTYVASQQFNSKAAAMRALAASGIAGHLTLRGDGIYYEIHNRDGSPAVVDSVTASFRRPVGDREDFQVTLNKLSEGRFEAAHKVKTGDWIVELISRRGDKLVMHEAERIDTAEFRE